MAVPISPRRFLAAALPTTPTGTLGLTLVETLVTFVLLGFLATLILQAIGFFAARYDGVQRVHRTASLEALQQNYFATTVQGLLPYGVEARRFRGDGAAFEGVSLEPLSADPGTPVTARWYIADDQVRYAESAVPGAPGIEWQIRPPHTSVHPSGSDSYPPGSDSRNNVIRTDIGMPSRPAPNPVADLAFHYADASANWYDHWPPGPNATPLVGAAKPQTTNELMDALAERLSARPRDTLSDPALDWTPRLIRLFSRTEGTVWLARVEPSARPLLTDVDIE